MTVRVALVDSGVNAEHPHVRGHIVTPGPSVDFEGELVLGTNTGDVLGHGTAAAAAILEHAPEIELYSIRVFEASAACPFTSILRALEHAIDAGCQFVNLSLGTTDDQWSDQVEELIAKAQVSGTQLIAPAAFRGLPSYPGCMRGVLGVLMDATLPREAPEERLNGDRNYWYASPYPRDLPNLPRSANLAGISMACANLTGILAGRQGAATRKPSE